MSICDALPTARQVVVGDRVMLCSQLRVRDLATLQAYLEIQRPHPLERHRAELAGLEGDDRRRMLARLRVADSKWPPRLHDAESDRVFQTEAGLAFWLVIVLGRDQEFTAVEAMDLVRGDLLTLDQLCAVQRVAFDVSPSQELRLLVNSGESGPKGEPPDWGGRIDEVALTHGWTYDQIGDLTLSQFSLALWGTTRSAPVPEDWSFLSPEEVRERLRQQRADLGMPEPGESGETPPASPQGGEGEGYLRENHDSEGDHDGRSE